MTSSLLRSAARFNGIAAALVPLLCLAVTLGIVISVPQASAVTSGREQRAATVDSLSAGPTRVVHIVAHPDDDLFFMNPVIQQAISEGIPVTSVYLTSGESDGINMNSSGIAALHREGLEPVADRPLYAEARQNGIRAAYALMAAGVRTSPWQRTVIGTAGGGQAELDVLRAKPSVQLVWLEMKEAGSVSGYAPVSLHGLWAGVTGRIPSVLTTGTPVRKPFSYTRDQVVSTLVGVLERYRPTLVRTQDPTPGKYPSADHQDHVYGARFVQAALARYAVVVPFAQRPHFTVENYMGYQTHNYAEVLDAAAARRKLRTLATYAWSDGIDDCGSPAGCGDRKLATGIGEYHWADDIRLARGGSTSWLAAGAGGTTWAFSVLDGQLAVWHSTARGPWSDARLLPGTGIDQGADAITLPDGRIAVFATRTELGATAAGYNRQVVYTVQETPGGEGFSPWKPLGDPATDNVNGTLDLSAPAAAVGADGRMSVYVRDGNYTLRGRTQTGDGSWTPWESLGGTGLAGDPATATATDGTRYVFDATPTSVTAWTSQGSDGALGPAVATGLLPTTLTLTAAPSGDGVGLWFRQPVSGDVLRTEATTGPEGLRLSPVTAAGSSAGGPTVACAGGVSGRGVGGVLGYGSTSRRSWSRSPLPFVGGPADICRVAGPTVGAVGWDARLHAAHFT